MRKMKKMLAIASAAAMLCGSAATMNVSAVTYDCDVNNDGEVSVLDVLVINQYMMGMYYVDDPSIMDVDGNHIITSGDAQCVMAVSVGNSYSVMYD